MLESPSTKQNTSLTPGGTEINRHCPGNGLLLSGCNSTESQVSIYSRRRPRQLHHPAWPDAWAERTTAQLLFTHRRAHQRNGSVDLSTLRCDLNLTLCWHRKRAIDHVGIYSWPLVWSLFNFLTLVTLSCFFRHLIVIQIWSPNIDPPMILFVNPSFTLFWPFGGHIFVILSWPIDLWITSRCPVTRWPSKRRSVTATSRDPWPPNCYKLL